MTDPLPPSYKVISGVEYHWDPRKSETNLRKHGVSFSDATLVFGDTLRVEEKNVKHSLSEPRFETVGRVDDRYILVVYSDVSDDENEAFRIISAREATPTEIKSYRAGFNKGGG